ncbi:MAG: hypothetical protein WAW09_03450 [Smithella sp.]
MKKQLPVKRKDKLPAINRTFSADDIALVRKFFKKKVENAPAKYKVDKNSENETCLVPDESDLTFHYAKLFRAFGTSSVALQGHFVNQLTSIFSGCTSKADSEKIVSACNMAIAIIDEIRPRDVIEGMLITQMIGVHNMAMETLRRAMLTEQTFAGKEANVYQATKMLRTFTQQMDTLKNYRQKGQQKVTVEHVNVNNGGQAIVGSVTKGGEG